MTGNQYFQYIGTIQEPLYEIENGTVTIEGAQYPVITERDKYLLRRFTIAEAERLQTLPEGYTRAAASVSAAQKAIGNGWTAEVIIHLLSYALKGIPKDEEIVVLSMYDGIGTGRYCLEKLGYSNIRYYATEIDKHAIEIAKSNYPDIVECGDAFAVREKEKDMATPYKECPHCGAHLDSGEKCECREEEIEAKNSQKYACGLTEQDVESGWECPLDNPNEIVERCEDCAFAKETD